MFAPDAVRGLFVVMALLALPSGEASADIFDMPIVAEPLPELRNPSRCESVAGCRDSDRSGRRHHGVVLDCSGRKRGAAHSLREAVRRVPVNGEILILGAPHGRTCIADGTVITKPLTIRPLDAIGSAYIEGRTTGSEPSTDPHAERRASCLEVNLPVGDSLKIIGVNFVVRGGKLPCVKVLAGTVEVSRSRIDSRGTRWAFDVSNSGRLVLEDSKIETDGGGVHARRVVVEMRRVDIQLERGRRGIGASLTGADGVVSELSVIGGEVGLVASSGSRGLLVENPVISDAGVGIEVVGQAGQGAVTIRGANIQRSIVGVWARNNARLELLGGNIRQSEKVGIFIDNSGAIVRGMAHVDGGIYAVAISRYGTTPPVKTAPTPPVSKLCEGPPNWGDESEDGYQGGAEGESCDYIGSLSAGLSRLDSRHSMSGVQMSDASPLGLIDIDQNTLGPAREAVIKLAEDAKIWQMVRITNNILDCGKASCISGKTRHVEDRGNRCTSSGWFGSCH